MQFFVAFSNSTEFATNSPPADFVDVLREDQARIRAMYAEGTVRAAWTFDREEKGGALLFEARSREHLDELLATVPLVKRGYNDCEVFPLAPFAGFSPAP